MGSKSFIACIFSLTAFVAIQAGASATTSNNRMPGTLVYALPAGPGGITLEAGGADSAITIATHTDTNSIDITDAAGARVDPRFRQYADSCDQASKTHVRCSLFEPGGIRMLLRSGSDSATVDSSEPGLVAIYGLGGKDTFRLTHPTGRSKLKGGLNDDVIAGGSAEDLVDGGRGDDDLRGNAGDDLLVGDLGLDRLRAGSGSDVVRADDGGADRLIDCGAGDDRAVLDGGLDPAPQNCETVGRR